ARAQQRGGRWCPAPDATPRPTPCQGQPREVNSPACIAACLAARLLGVRPGGARRSPDELGSGDRADRALVGPDRRSDLLRPGGAVGLLPGGAGVRAAAVRLQSPY